MMWNYRGKPKPDDDCRKLVTLLQDDMTWIGIRAWHGVENRWYNGNEPERDAQIFAWMNLPEPASGRWVHGKLVHPEEGISEYGYPLEVSAGD